MARHISELNIESFRGIRNLDLKDFGDVNILVGDNNSGKSSILEALLMFEKPSDFSNILFVANLREGYRYTKKTKETSFNSFLNLFNKTQEEKYISMFCYINGNKNRIFLSGIIEKMFLFETDVQMATTPAQSVVETFIGDLIAYNNAENNLEKEKVIDIQYNKYSKIQSSENKKIIEIAMLSTIDHIVGNIFTRIVKDKNLTKEVVNVLKIFDSNITDLRVISDDSNNLIEVIDHEKLGYMPMSSYGDGIKKVIAIANSIATAKNGILLIDEIETAIHTSALKKTFDFVLEASKKQSVQLFATTHSLEALDKLLDCAKSSGALQSIRVITLVKKENETVARILTGEKAYQVREDYDTELR